MTDEANENETEAIEVAQVREIASKDEPIDEHEAAIRMDAYDMAFIRTEVAEDAGLVYTYWVKDSKGNLKKKHRIGYPGIKQMVLEQCNQGNVISVEENPVIKLVKYDESDRTQWVWQVDATSKSLTTQMRSVGYGEHPYLKDDGEYDKFGRTAAVSKALRNAYRVQVPESAIQVFLHEVARRAGFSKRDPSSVSKAAAAAPSPKEKPKPKKKPTSVAKEATPTVTSAKNTQTQNKSSSNEADDPVSPYMPALEKLGYKGDRPATPAAAVEIINALAAGKEPPASASAKAEPEASKPASTPKKEKPKSKNPNWKSDPATNAQLGKLKALGVAEDELPDTKGEAHDMISKLLEEADEQ